MVTSVPENKLKVHKIGEDFTLSASGEDKDGNKVWDCEGYKTFLNNAAGNGGVLNREELIGAVQQLKDKPPVEHTDEEGETVPEKCHLEKNNNSVDTTLPHKVKFGDSWEELVNAYFPTWKECSFKK